MQVLFNNTIYHNVIQGLVNTPYETETDEVKMKLVIEACRAANAAEFIEQLEDVSFLEYIWSEHRLIFL